MRNAYIDTLFKLAKRNKAIMALTSDTGIFMYDKFRESFPQRFINVGIAETNLIGVSAGLALMGKIPFCYAITSFMPVKCIEQIKIDVCSQNLNVKIVSVGSGFVYGVQGPTHHSLEDVGLLRTLPNITILCPCDAQEAKKATQAALKIKGPVYIRLGKNKEPDVYDKDYEFKVGKATCLKKGKDATLISTGTATYYTLQAAKMLEKEKISCRVINMHTIKPIDKQAIINSSCTKYIISVEEHSVIGGLGSAVAEVISKAKLAKAPRLLTLGIPDRFLKTCSDYQTLQECFGLSAEKIAFSVKKFLKD